MHPEGIRDPLQIVGRERGLASQAFGDARLRKADSSSQLLLADLLARQLSADFSRH